ncbi:hypothetical protein ABW19_dt0204243 [Dactylella cylindrospora]|nr:hypothetical protein ABW19_dt0204243 [Dactylella cylindrospora]
MHMMTEKIQKPVPGRFGDPAARVNAERKGKKIAKKFVSSTWPGLVSPGVEGGHCLIDLYMSTPSATREGKKSSSRSIPTDEITCFVFIGTLHYWNRRCEWKPRKKSQTKRLKKKKKVCGQRRVASLGTCREKMKKARLHCIGAQGK